MEELIKQVSEKAGIDAEKARSAVEAVMNFIKERFPAGLAGQLEQMLQGGAGGGGLGEIMGKLGGMFGGKKE